MSGSDDYEAVIGLEVHAELLTRVEDLLRLLGRVRRAAEHAHLSGLPRHARRAAGAEPPRRRVRDPRRARHRTARIAPREPLRAQELLLPRPAARATRSASTSCRSASAARIDIVVDGAHASASASRASTWRRTPARTSTTRTATRAWSTSTAPACRCSRSSASPTCARPPRPAPTCARCARSSSTSRSATATWRKAASAATPTSRCARAGTTTLGTKVEIKNMNSFRAVETRDRRTRSSARSTRARATAARSCRRRGSGTPTARRPARCARKEYAHDYRYFPEPDLLPLVVARGLGRRGARAPARAARRAPRALRRASYGLPAYDADVLTARKDVADYFEAAVAAHANAKALSNWVMGEVLRIVRERKLDDAPAIRDWPVAAGASRRAGRADRRAARSAARSPRPSSRRWSRPATPPARDRRRAGPDAGHRRGRDRRRRRRGARRQPRQGRRVPRRQGQALRLLRRPGDEGDRRQGEPEQVNEILRARLQT